MQAAAGRFVFRPNLATFDGHPCYLMTPKADERSSGSRTDGSADNSGTEAKFSGTNSTLSATSPQNPPLRRSTSDIPPEMVLPPTSRKPRSKHRRSLLSRFIGIRESEPEEPQQEISPLWGSRHVDLFFNDFPRERKPSRQSVSSSGSRTSGSHPKNSNSSSMVSPGTSFSHPGAPEAAIEMRAAMREAGRDSQNRPRQAGITRAEYSDRSAELPPPQTPERPSAAPRPSQISSTYSVAHDPLSKRAENHSIRRSEASGTSSSTGIRGSDDTLRHPDMPLTVASAKGRTMFARIYRNDGSFGTVAGSPETTAEDLLHLAARKFFIPNVDMFHLVCVMPDKVAVLPPHSRPFEIIHDKLRRLGYTDRDSLMDICRKDLTCLCKIILTDHALMPPSERVVAALKKRPDRVVLKHQDLLTLPAYILDNASRVEFIDISLSFGMHVPDKYWTELRRIKMLKAENCNVGNLLRLSFLPWLSTLTLLDLSRNGLKVLDVDFGKMPHLRVLNLRGNNLSELPPSFDSLELQRLYLGTNSLETFDHTMQHLVELDLSYNKLTELPNKLCSYIQLEKLNLAGNKISRVPENFDTIPNLLELDIRYNHFSNIVPLLQGKLHTVWASRNTRLENQRGPGSSSTNTPAGSPLLGFTPRRLPTELNNLRRMDLSYSRSIRLVPELRLDSVTTLELQGSHLVAIPEEVFVSMPNLEVVDVSKNRVSRLPSSIGKLQLLKELSVADNSLSTLPNELYYLPRLEVLDLHSNNFKSLPPAARELRRLRVLNLSSNLLESLPSLSFHDYDDLTPTRDFMSAGLFPTQSHRSYDSRNSLGPSREESRRGSAVSALSLDATASVPSAAPTPTTIMASDDESVTASLRHEMFASSFGEPPAIQELYLADNRLGDDCFEEISYCSELRILNLGYNEITDIPAGTFEHLPLLRELVLSGNRLVTLPQEDLNHARSLRSLYINSNKLHSLPVELTNASELETLDVACNNLRYNVSNKLFEWNWRRNKKLRLLNFSSNRRFEILRQVNQRSGDDEHREDLTDFCVLPNLQILGLMDVTVTTPMIPDQTENCRVRTYGSDISIGRFGVADYLAEGEALGINDLMIDSFRGNKNELLCGVFDGFLAREGQGNRISKMVQELIAPLFKEELEKCKSDAEIPDCLRRAFLAVHREIGNATMVPKEEVSHSFVGQYSTVALNLTEEDRESCTGATLVYIKDRKVYLASSGGVKGLLARANGQYQLLSNPTPLQSDFNLEMMRTGGGVMSQDLINGRIPHNPVIGAYSEGTLTSAAPVVSEYTLQDNSDLVVIASSELWDFMSYQTAADLARSESGIPMLGALKLRDFALAYGRDKIKQMMVMVCGGARGQYDANLRESVSYFGDKRRRQTLPEDGKLARYGAEVIPPQGEVTMVFTDVRHSTVLWEALPELVMQAAMEMHNEVMRRSCRRIGGYEVKNEGDAFVVSFHTAVEAVLWCLAVQEQLLEADWPLELLQHPECAPIYAADGQLLYRGLSVRMGIHCGRPLHDADPVTSRMDYFGPMVNKTARISAIAAGGQITVSADLLNAIKLECDQPQDEPTRKRCNTLSSRGYYLEELGELKLKGIEMPELIYIIYPDVLKQRHDSVMPQNEPQVVITAPAGGTGTHICPHVGSPPTGRVGSIASSRPSLVSFGSTPSSVSTSRVALAAPPSVASAAQQPIGSTGAEFAERAMSLTQRLERLCALTRTGYTSGLLASETPQALEHYVTRIENSIDSLALQLAPSLGDLEALYGKISK